MTTQTKDAAITVNGERWPLPAGGALAAVLRCLDIDPETARGVAVALNDEVVRRQQWPEVSLEAGDRVEVITARQGG